MGAHDQIPLESIPDLEWRLWSKIDKQGPDECWLWSGTGYADERGNRYGIIVHKTIEDGSRKQRNLASHRLIYRIEKGPIPEGLFICHTCNNTMCCNPAHLYAGTAQDNSNDMVNSDRSTKGDRNPSAKLTTDKVDEIKRLRKEGHSFSNIAKRFNVCPQTIDDIDKGRTWGWHDDIWDSIQEDD